MRVEGWKRRHISCFSRRRTWRRSKTCRLLILLVYRQVYGHLQQTSKQNTIEMLLLWTNTTPPSLKHRTGQVCSDLPKHRPTMVQLWHIDSSRKPRHRPGNCIPLKSLADPSGFWQRCFAGIKDGVPETFTLAGPVLQAVMMSSPSSQFFREKKHQKISKTLSFQGIQVTWSIGGKASPHLPPSNYPTPTPPPW